MLRVAVLIRFSPMYRHCVDSGVSPCLVKAATRGAVTPEGGLTRAKEWTMAEAANLSSTCTDNVTHAQRELIKRFQQRSFDAERALNKLDDVSAMLLIMSGSDEFEDNQSVARALSFLAATLTDASLEARKALFQGDS